MMRFLVRHQHAENGEVVSNTVHTTTDPYHVELWLRQSVNNGGGFWDTWALLGVEVVDDLSVPAAPAPKEKKP